GSCTDPPDTKSTFIMGIVRSIVTAARPMLTSVRLGGAPGAYVNATPPAPVPEAGDVSVRPVTGEGATRHAPPAGAGTGSVREPAAAMKNDGEADGSIVQGSVTTVGSMHTPVLAIVVVDAPSAAIWRRLAAPRAFESITNADTPDASRASAIGDPIG